MVFSPLRKRVNMNRTESLDILNKYIDALKEKAETEERLRTKDSKYKGYVVDAKVQECPFSKVLIPFLIIPAPLTWIIHMIISSGLTYKTDLPVTLAVFAVCEVIGITIAKIIHISINRNRRKQNAALGRVFSGLSNSEEKECRGIISNCSRRIAEAESALPLSCHSSLAAKQARKKILDGKAQNIEEATEGYTKEDWEWAYKADPRFYNNSEKVPFGVLALTEATRTVLPKEPKDQFLFQGNTISKWRIVLVSLTNDDVFGDSDYFEILSKLDRYILDSDKDSILVRGLTLKEMERLIK